MTDKTPIEDIEALRREATWRRIDQETAGWRTWKFLSALYVGGSLSVIAVCVLSKVVYSATEALARLFR
jgi:hypothetical protein